MRRAVGGVALALLVLTSAYGAVGTGAAKMEKGSSGMLVKPYFSGITYSAKKEVACAQVNRYVGPSAVVKTGVARADIHTLAIGCGGVSLLTQAGFWSKMFEPNRTGEYNLTASWYGSFSILLTTAIGIFGTSHAEGSAEFYMNVRDVTDQEYVLGNYATSTIYNPGLIDDGLDYYAQLWGYSVNITADGWLTAGHEYRFATFFDLFCQSIAVGLTEASCNNDWGSGSNGATLSFASWAPI